MLLRHKEITEAFLARESYSHQAAAVLWGQTRLIHWSCSDPEKPQVQLGNLLFLSLRRRCASHEALGQLVLHFIYIFTIKQVVDKIDKEDTASELVRQTSKHFG